jgi:cullin-associated NEDD8-dissociated protein 1
MFNKEQLMKAIFGSLVEGNGTLNLRKKSCNCVGAFAAILNVNQLSSLCRQLIDLIKKCKDKVQLVILVQCVSLVAKSVGNKLAPFLDELIPILQQFIINLNRNSSVDLDNELAESCLTTIQMMIKRCPGGFPKQTISDLLKNALNLACYDPNYLYNEDDSEMADAGDDGGWGSDFDDDQQNMEDDDDTSWKVRRGAFRIIQSIILTRPELRSDLIDNCTV